MKRSQHIRLVLLGGLSGAALASSGPTANAQLSSQGYALHGNAFTNDHYLPHAGYYHAPYRAWFPHPYNHFDSQQQKFCHGGQWSPQPHQSFTNISEPLPQAVAAAVAAQPRPPVQHSTTRSGFGGTSHSWGGIGS